MSLHSGKFGYVQIVRFPNAKSSRKYANWKKSKSIEYTKYNIKETDMRVKTGTFSSPQYIDLTTGLYAVRFLSKYHENFCGIILDVDYDEKDDIYNYQCQDFSRLYISKGGLFVYDFQIYRMLLALVSHFEISGKTKKENRNKCKAILSGLKPLKYYNQSLYKGNIYGGNPFSKKMSIYSKDKSVIELIRSIVFSQLGYFDVYFNERGILQIEPLSKKDWENTGLHLTTHEFINRKFKFSTTNSITDVGITVDDPKTEKGKLFSSKDLVKLDLSAFFGNIQTTIPNPIKKTNSVKNNNSGTVTSKDNPYGNKAKKIWIGADGGSGGFAEEICRLLEKAGWYVHYSGEGAGVHTDDYDNITSDYQVLAIVDNGFCCTTVKEAYEGYCAPGLRNKNITVVFMFDSRSWNEGMRPYKYGDFKNYVAHTAHDDPSGYCTTMYVDDYFRKHNVKYCANPSAKGMVDQFLAGGYYAYKGIKV